MHLVQMELPIRRKHTCSVCGKTDQWRKDWSWFGSRKDVEDGQPILKTCSKECWKQIAAAIRARATEDGE